MIARVVLLLAGAAAAAGAVLFGRRKARQRARARRRAERQAKRARAAGATSVAVPAIEVTSPAAEPGPTFTSIRGIGPAMEERLRAAGVTSVAQIAGWSDADLEGIAPSLKVTPERIRREAWVEQARAVVSGTPAAV